MTLATKVSGRASRTKQNLQKLYHVSISRHADFLINYIDQWCGRRRGSKEEIEENSYNYSEKGEEIFCLLWICHPVEIKAFQGDHSLAGRILTAFRPLNFCSAFLLYSQMSHPVSSQLVKDLILVTDPWLKRITILCETHLYKNAKKQRESFKDGRKHCPLFPYQLPRLLLGTPVCLWYACINYCSIGPFNTPKSHLHSKVLIKKRENPKQKQARVATWANTPSRGLA